MTLTNLKTGFNACRRISPAIALLTIAWLIVCTLDTTSWVRMSMTAVAVAVLGYALHRYLSSLNRLGADTAPGDAPCVPDTSERFRFRTVVVGARLARATGCPFSSTLIAEVYAALAVVAIGAWLVTPFTVPSAMEYLTLGALAFVTAWGYLKEMHAIGAEAAPDTPVLEPAPDHEG